MTHPTSSTAVATKAPTYNPVEFKRNFTALAVQNPKKATDMAADWRVRLENALVQAETAMEAFISTVSVAGSNLVFSIATNYQAEKKAHIEDQWKLPDLNGDATQKKAAEWITANPDADFSKSSPFKDGKIKDPTTLGLPISVWLVLGTGGAALAAGRYASPGVGIFTRNMAMGAVTNMTGDLGRMAARAMFKSAQERAAKKQNGG